MHLDDKQPLKTAVYQPDKSQKKPNLVLILLGHRWLALDIKAKTVYQVLPSDLQAQGADFESGDLFTSDRLVPTKDWIERDVGPAERIKLTLNDYGRELEIMLPHPADLRSFLLTIYACGVGGAPEPAVFCFQDIGGRPLSICSIVTNRPPGTRAHIGCNRRIPLR